MAKSALDSRFEKGDVLINQIRDDQLERLRRVGDLWGSQMAARQDLGRGGGFVRGRDRGRGLV